MTAHILYSYYLDANGKDITIGGVQTYLTNLGELLVDMGVNVIIYQQAKENFERDFHKYKIIGIKGHSDRGYVIGQRLFERCKSYVNAKEDIIIFGTDTLNIPCPGYKTISIQHGIYWDIPQKGKLSSIVYFKEFWKKTYKAWKQVKRVACVDAVVCVDYNFINWYRSVVPQPQTRLKAIMNFTDIPDKAIVKNQNVVNIIFARRLVEYRGTLIFTEAITKILQEYGNVNVTIAGSGPDEKWMKERFKDFPKVLFTTYNSKESLDIHADKHIAIVPTIGSEGTSLSLLEAMASNCAVICSNVGGMTNIVQNRFDGLIIDPTAKNLYFALKCLLDDAKFRETLAKHAREKIECSFSKDCWRTEWKKVIDEISNK